jgi:hypothetical protein
MDPFLLAVLQRHEDDPAYVALAVVDEPSAVTEPLSLGGPPGPVNLEKKVTQATSIFEHDLGEFVAVRV